MATTHDRCFVNRRGRTALVAAFLSIAAAAIGFAQTTAPPPAPIAAFIAATRDYATMHRRIERQLPPIEVNSSAETIGRLVDAMANAMRAARSDARQGDIFTPEVAPLLRNAISDGLIAYGFTADDVRNAEQGDGIDPSTVTLRVNGNFPWVVGSAMFPCVIAALPPLPPELQYRIVGNTLVLIDLHASTIVDLLPNALVDFTVRD